MARDYYDESKGKNPWSKKKKKNNQETSQKQTSSPSVSQKVTSSTYGGSTTGSNYATGIRRTTSSGGGSNSGRSTGSSSPQSNAPQPTSQRRYQQTGSNYGKSQRQMRSGGVLPTQERRNEPVTSNRRNTPVTSTSRQRNGVATTSREMMEQRKAEQESQRKNNSEARRSLAQAQKSGDYDRASKLHDEIYGPSERRSKVNEWDKDISDTITQTLKQVKASDIRYLNQSMQGITQKDAFLYTTADQRKKADEKVARTEEKYSRQLEEANQALEDIKNKHGYLGKRGLEAVSSTTGMAVDLGIGALTGGASLFHMKMRSTGGTMGQVKKKADALRSQLKSTGYYTDDELDEMFRDVEARDLLNAEVNGDIEGISELFFRGFGPVAKYVGGSSIAEKIGSKLLNKAGGKATSGILKNVVKGTTEEIAEEEMAGPAEAWASNLIYGNKFQGYQEDAIKKSLTDQSNALRSQIQSPADAQSAAARLSSPAFKEESIETYMEAGHSREDATQLAEMSIEYLSAALSGDVDGMKIAQDAMVEKLAGGDNDQREKFTLQDAIDSAVSTAMMTLPTGMPGAMSTQYMGNSYKENFGLNAVKQQTEIIRNWGDEEDKKKAEGIIESIDNGDDMSGTQVYEVIQKAAQYAIENKEADNTKMRTAEKKMADNDLRVAPIDSDGNLGPQTQQRYLKIISDTVSRYQALAKLSNQNEQAEDFVGPNAPFSKRNTEGLNEADVLLGADIGASFNTGVLESEQVNDLVSGSETVKEVFRDVTGVDISQFDNNKQMLDSLMAAAADNLVNSARLEQVAWNDEVKGGVADTLSKGIGGEGDKAVSKILDSVDPRDRSQFLLTADVARSVYERARNTEESWDETKRRFKTMYPSANVDTMKDVYKAAKEDKAKAETYYFGKVVESGEKATRSSLNSAETGYVAGKFTDKRQNKEGKSLKEESLLKAIASSFGINIEVVDDLSREKKDKNGNAILDENGKPIIIQDNGYINIATNTLVLNSHPDAERTITDTAAHELTHHIAVHAPKEYVKLQRYIMDAWYRQDADRFNEAINSTKALYKTQKGQDLTTEKALEELIANGAADFDWSDEQFISDVTVNEPSLAQAIINAIKDILRKIRRILASGDVIDEASTQALYSKAVELDTVRNMWVTAAQMARSNRAQMSIDEWQENANKNSRHSVAEDNRFSISPQQDADYMKAVESGDMDKAQRMVEEAAKMAGYDINVKLYHGTDAEFNIFKSGGGQYGEGVYLTYDEDTANSYGSRTITVYTRPLKVANYTDLGNVLGIEDLYDYWERVEGDVSMEDITDLEYHPESVDALIKAGYNAFEDEGNYGLVIFSNKTGGIDSMVKSADPVTYDDNGDVIPLSERFNQESPDIRYSISETDSEGNTLSEAQREFFKDSKVVDESGRLIPVYHSTDEGGFTVFDPSVSEDEMSLFFTDSRMMSESYINYGELGDITPGEMYNMTQIIDVSDLPDDITNDRIFGIEVYNDNGTIAEGDDFLGVASDVARYFEEQGIDIEEEYAVDPEAIYNKSDGAMDEAIELFLHCDEIELDYNMTYTGNENKESEVSGTYTCYLNLTNPLIVDAEESLWNEIPFETQDRFENAYIKLEEKDGKRTLTLGYSNPVTISVEDGYKDMAEKINTFLGFKKDDSVGVGIAYGFDWQVKESPTGYVEQHSQDIRNLSESNHYELRGEGLRTTRDIAEIASERGYDGAIIRNVIDYGASGYADAPANVYIAFTPNQVKDAHNLNPTEDADIRYSLNDPANANNYVEEQMLEDSDNTIQDLSSDDLDIRYSFGEGGTFYEKGFHAKSGANVTGSDVKKRKGNPLLESGKEILARTMKKNINAELKKQGISTRSKEAKAIVEARIESVMNFMDAMNAFMEETGLQYTFIGMQDVYNAKISVRKTSDGVQAITMSAMVKNGEYPINFDFTTICKKRQAFNAIIEKLTAESAEGVDISLSPQELGEINNALRKEGLETACLGCFVEARRYNMQNYTNKVCELWNKCVDEYAASIGVDPADIEDFNFSNGEETTEEKFQDAADTFFTYENTAASKKNPEDRFKHIIRSSQKTYMKHLHPADLITSNGIQHIKDMSTKSKDFFGMLKSAYGVAAPKETIKYVPYNSEVALLPANKGKDKDGNTQTMLDYLKSIGGIRMQSFSDYLVANTFDYMQMVADMAARGFPAHAYTKEIAFARVFGMTGIKINLSIMYDVQNLNYWRGIFKNADDERLREIASKYAGLQYFENADDIPEEFKDYDEDGNLILNHGSIMEIDEDGVKGYLTYLVGDENRSQRHWEETFRRVLEETGDEEIATEQANEFRKWIQSINFKEAKELQRKRGYGVNCGMIGVGLSDANILLMLNDDNMPYIIPYHASGLPDVIKQHTGLNFATNYEDTQNTRIFVSFTKNGEELGYDYVRDLKNELGSWQKAWEKVSEEIRNGDIIANGRTPKAATDTEPAEVNKDGNSYVLHGTADFDFYGKLENGATPQEAAEMYLDYCDEYGLLPVFPQFAGHPNYYKLLVDYSVTDLSNKKATSPQGTVKNIYPGSNGSIANIDEGSTDYKGIKGILEDEFKKLNEKNKHRDEVVEKIVDEWKRYSITPDMDDAYMDAVNSNNMEEAQRLVDEAAKMAGYNTRAYHGTSSYGFTEFSLTDSEGEMIPAAHGKVFGEGFYFTSIKEATARYSGQRYTIDEESGESVKVGTPGVYDVFLDLGNTLEIDWNEMRKRFTSQKDFERFLRNESEDKDSITIKNIKDGSSVESTVYVIGPNAKTGRSWISWLNDTTNRIKSADTVTYAEDGSVIPLSERFDPNNNDIRYSLPTQDSDGNILTDGQMEYFKNSQARDEQGRLVPVYHSTDEGGFTVFDPTQSQDNRSLFFTDDLNMSKSYFNREDSWKGEEGEILDAYNLPAEPTKGTYAAYLNLENPLLVNGMGHNWDDIPYGGNPVQVRNASLLLEPEWDMTEDGDPLLSGYTLDVSWEYLTDDSEWETKRISNSFDNPNPEEMEWFPKEEIENYVESEGLSKSFFKEMVSNGEEEEMDGSISYQSEEDEETTIYDTAYTTREISEIASNEGYDSVIIRNVRDYGGFGYGNAPHDIYIAFSSNQVKDINNENPSENPDIRYSVADDDSTMNYMQSKAESTDELWSNDPVIAEGRIRYSMTKKDFINGVTNEWNPAWRTEGKVLKEESVKKDIRNIIMGAMRNSDTKARYRQEMVDETVKIARQAYNLFKSGKSAEAGNLLYDHALSIIENLEFFVDEDQTDFYRYKELRDYLRHTKITVPDRSKSDIAYAGYRSRNFGRVLLGDGGIAPDQAWIELHELWPEFFTEDNKGDVQSIMESIEAALDATKPFAQAYSSEECMEFAADIAADLYEVIYYGEPMKSLADKYDEKAKAMKVRHAEAMREFKAQYDQKLKDLKAEMKQKEKSKLEAQKERLTDKYESKIEDLKTKQGQKLREQKRKADFEIASLKQNREYNIQRLKAEKARAVEEEKEKRRQSDAERRYNRAHRDLYNRVLNEYNTLTDMLLKPSHKDRTKNIPEQLRQPVAEMLAVFDLEKERSKKLEEKYRIPTRTQLDFRQVKDALEKVAKEEGQSTEFETYFNYINGKITDIADKMDKMNTHTIDALSNEDIEVIKDMLAGLIESVKNWHQLEIDGQSYQAQQICDKVGEGADEHQSLYGKAKKYGSLIGFLDNIVNMGELTPIYFFRQLKGMYDMYRQIRRGFDDYVRNNKMIMDRLSEIMSDYYKKNKRGQRVYGSEVEEWRHSETAETFDLTYGSITLTVAQRMSLYCLAKREQAKGHMLSDNGGVVASEITAGSKIHKAEEEFKGKTIEYKQLQLTPADIDNIITSLTPEQIHIAEELQKLMSDDMSELGNKTSMKMLGIKLYKETEYFPIKIQGESKGKDLDNISVREKVRNPGFSNPLKENATNPIIIDDIFTVVAKHCNEMNLYASYAVPLTNFMKVYNGSVMDERSGKAVKIQTIIKETYGEKAIDYIDNFLDDINGNSFKRHGGLNDVLDKALGQAKKAAVFANLRVALQQPTAIVRAFAVMKVKYFKGVKPSAKETQEMFDHCPIALWKSLGYYDTHFGRDIEDVMMGKDVPSKMDKYMSEIYGALDNMTWGMIWQAVKNEIEETRKDLKVGSPEFFEACSERASFVFDSTQVVDSPFHRSNDMRSKDTFQKQLTSFQAEPTLSFNVLRQGIMDAREAAKKGDTKKAADAISRIALVWVGQAFTVAVAQSLVDALRRKGHKDGDDDEDQAMMWYEVMMKYFTQNFVDNFSDDVNPINNIYWFKDFVPGIVNVLKGEYVYGQQNLAYQWFDSLTKGIQAVKKKWEKGDSYKKSWYDCFTELMGGIGYMCGFPAKTVMRGTKNAFYWFNKISGANVFADDGTVKSESVIDSVLLKMGYKKKDSDGESSGKSSKAADKEKAAEEKKAESKAVKKILKSGMKQGEKAIPKTEEQLLSEIEEKTIGYYGEDRDRRIWDIVSDGYTDYIEKGDYGQINKIRNVIEKAGGNVQSFDNKVLKASKSAYKKMMVDDPTDAQKDAQINIRNYLLENGMTETEISAEICYKSDTARDLKAAFRMGNEDYIVDELVTLLRAGITRDDIYKLYKYRNYGAKDYDGKYTQPEYRTSQGSYIWPTQGTITSHFGYRDAPTAGASSNHQAIDIGAPQGTPVVAADGGVVIEAGSNGGYGNSVGIRHDDGTISYYNHLYTWGVKVGDKVSQGQQIGQVGSTGISTGPHLDFRLYKDGEYLDPEQYLQG